MKRYPEPLGGEAPEQIPLARAPLVTVIAQIRFPVLAMVAQADNVASFQERIRPNYPLGSKEQNQHIAFDFASGQAVKTETETIWRFASKDHLWRVSLAPSFVALESRKYGSRNDFISRMRFILEALQQTIDPKLSARVGIRYVDRIEGKQLENLELLVRAEILGPRPFFGKGLRHMISDLLLDTEEGAVLNLKCGVLPANATHDPAVMEPSNKACWYLDLDMFEEAPEDFHADFLAEKLERFSSRIYSVFRYVVTPQFLETYGSKQ